MEPADMRPPRDPFASWLGRVRVARPGEGWPRGEAGPLAPLCQVNVVELPERPRVLRGVAFVAVFGRGDEASVRAYPSLSDLIPWHEVERAPDPRPIRWEPDDAAAECDRVGGASDVDGFVLCVAGFSVTRTGEEWQVVASGR
jgi:hypothetical protein